MKCKQCLQYRYLLTIYLVFKLIYLILIRIFLILELQEQFFLFFKILFNSGWVRVIFRVFFFKKKL
jgi:hypothetical protein